MKQSKKQYIIIGTSAAGLSAAVTLRSLDSESSIICISDEHSWPYNKCLLPDYLCGDRSIDSIFTRPQHFFEQSHIELMLGVRVIEIDGKSQRILLSDKKWIDYDSLLITTGARPRKPEFATDAIGGIFNGYYLDDTQALLQYIKENRVQKACIVGSGFTGLEYADALHALGIAVTVIEKEPYILPHLVNQRMSEILRSRIERQGAQIICDRLIESVIQKENRFAGVTLNDGTHLESQVLIQAIGSVPNLQLVENAGGAVTKKGIVTNEFMQTSIANIYAAGDCVQVKDFVSGRSVRSFKWSDAALQGSCAAYTMVGQPKKYEGVACVLKSFFFGFDIFIAGRNPKPEHTFLMGTLDQDFGVFDSENDLIEYALIIGHRELVPEIRKAYRQRLSFTSYQNQNGLHF